MTMEALQSMVFVSFGMAPMGIKLREDKRAFQMRRHFTG